MQTGKSEAMKKQALPHNIFTYKFLNQNSYKPINVKTYEHMKKLS